MTAVAENTQQCTVRRNQNFLEVIGNSGYYDGKLLGYAVCDSGGWNGWGVSQYDCNSMRRVKWNAASPDEAIKSILKFVGSHGMGKVA